MLRLALVLALIGSPAVAQMQCAGFADLAALYSEAHGETVAVRGLDTAGQAMIVLANPDTGTWTLLVVQPNGIACPIAFGDAFEYHKPKPNA